MATNKWLTFKNTIPVYSENLIKLINTKCRAIHIFKAGGAYRYHWDLNVYSVSYVVYLTTLLVA
jgi:hypothetical protein